MLSQIKPLAVPYDNAWDGEPFVHPYFGNKGSEQSISYYRDNSTFLDVCYLKYASNAFFDAIAHDDLQSPYSVTSETIFSSLQSISPSAVII